MAKQHFHYADEILDLPNTGTGPAGVRVSLDAEPGADGDMGPPGVCGANGATGAPGPTGPTGPTGPIGPALYLTAEVGDDGCDGTPGARGPAGVAGSNGSPGPTGPAVYLEAEPGEDGERGPAGSRGVDGAAGSVGAQGPAGPMGAPMFLEPEMGEDGMMGQRGATGAAGVAGSSYTLVATLSGNQATGANTTPVTLTGLVWTYAANSVYFFRWIGKVKPAAATTGCGFQLDVSSAVTEIAMGFTHQLANTGTLSGGHSIADDASVGVSSGLPGTSTYPVIGNGMLRTGANTGTAQLRFRSETTAVTTAIAGMTLVVEKVV